MPVPAIHGVEAVAEDDDDLLRAFDVARVRLSNQLVIDRFTREHPLAKRLAQQGIIDTLRVMARFVDGYEDFAQARTREGGRDYSFIEYIRAHRRPPDFLLTDKGDLVPLNGFIARLAAGRILGNTDFIGGDGRNAGFKWIRDDNGAIIAAQTVEIGRSQPFQFNTSVNGPKLDDVRDIQIANNEDGVTIKWESMTPEQRDIFLSFLQNSARYLSEEVLSFLFYRKGCFQHMPVTIAENMASDFRQWFALQLQIFGEEISRFKRENPSHQLRIQYIDKWGERPLLLSGENLFSTEFFIPCRVTKPDGQRGDIGRSSDSTKSIDPHHLFAEARHVLLCGPSGAGKTGFSQEIAHRWASGQLFNDRFDAVYLLPLRELNKELEEGGFLHQVTDPDVFLSRAIANNLLRDQSLTDVYLREIRNNRERTLVILDGYNEATTNLSEALLGVLSDRGLSILLTSEAAFTKEISPYIDQTIESTGFSEEKIRLYATQFFTRNNASPSIEKRVDDFVKAIKKTPGFLELSRNPLQLQILCSLWELGADQTGFPIGKTGIYQSMINQIFLWECRRRGEDVRGISEATKESVFSTLGLIAQRGLADGKLSIPQLDLIGWLQGSQWSERNLIETGLLKTSGNGANTSYNFPHQALQEYLAAYWISNRPQEEQESFIQAYRDNPRYRAVIPLLAGMIYQRDPTASKEATKDFFRALCQNVVLTDPSSSQKLVKIIIKSINECPGYTGELPAVESLFREYPALLDTKAPLHRAIKRGETGFLKWLVSRQGPEVLNKKTTAGLTLMHIAAMNGDLETAQFLGHQKPELISKSAKNGNMPMHFAAASGNIELMRYLDEKDSELFCKRSKSGMTPMHSASFSGRVGAIEWLAEKDPALLRTQTDDGMTPLYVASVNGQLEAMKCLDRKDPELVHIPANDGSTPMDFADSNGHLEAMQWSRGTPMHSAAKNGDLEAMQSLYEKDPDLVSEPDHNGLTPMHIAAANGQVKAMEFLDEKDRELIGKVDNDGTTPMHLAAIAGELAAMECLHNKDPQLLLIRDNNGFMPIHSAASNGQVAAMAWLEEKSPGLFRATTNGGYTVMHIAAMADQLEPMEWLHEKDPELFRTPTDDGYMPIHGAVSSGKLKAMQWLYEKDSAVLRVRANDGTSPMHAAVMEGQLAAMKYLHEKDPELFLARAAGGLTAMHLAAREGSLKAVKWLYKKDPGLLRRPADGGVMPIHLAAGEGHLDVMKFLHKKDPELLRAETNLGGTPMRAAASTGQVQTIDWLYAQDSGLLRTPSGVTPMHDAAFEGQVGAMECLYGKDPELLRLPMKDGKMPIHLAASKGQVEAMKWFYGKDPQLLHIRTNENCMPPVPNEERQLAGLQWLAELSKGLNPRDALPSEGQSEFLQLFQQSSSGLRPIQYAVMAGELEVMQYLYDIDPELFFKLGPGGSTLMHLAVRDNQLGAMNWLDGKDSELFRTPGNDGVTPMHLAVMLGQLGAMDWLHGKDPELFRRGAINGVTPISLAALFGQLEAIKWLYEKDASEINRGEGGSSPLEFAEAGKQEATIRWLIAHGAKKP